MKKLTVMAVLVTVVATILASVAFGVNSRSVNNSVVWTGGSGSPVSSMPTLLADGSGSPVPPMPTMFEPEANVLT
jgi:hypothetical protein